MASAQGEAIDVYLKKGDKESAKVEVDGVNLNEGGDTGKRRHLTYPHAFRQSPQQNVC